MDADLSWITEASDYETEIKPGLEAWSSNWQEDLPDLLDQRWGESWRTDESARDLEALKNLMGFSQLPEFDEIPLIDEYDEIEESSMTLAAG